MKSIRLFLHLVAVIFTFMLIGCNGENSVWTIIISPPRPYIAQDIKSAFDEKIHSVDKLNALDVFYSDKIGISITIQGSVGDVTRIIGDLSHILKDKDLGMIGISYYNGIPSIDDSEFKDFASVVALKPKAKESGLSVADLERYLVFYNSGTNLMDKESVKKISVNGTPLGEYADLSFSKRETVCR